MIQLTPKMRIQLKGFALAFAGMALMSCNYITAKIAMEGFNPKVFGALWYIVATILGLVMIFSTGQGRQLRIRGEELRLMLLLGMMLTFVALLGWTALSMMDPTFN